MPRTKTYLSTAEFAVLGLLCSRPAHGYELQRQLGATSSLGRVSPVEPAMVYAILKSLSGLELIDGEWDNSVYPPKAVYAANNEGYAAFQRWLHQPVARIRDIRGEFMVKLYFALQDDGPIAQELLQAQIEACRNYISDTERELDEAESGTFDALVIDSKVSAARLTLEWLERWLPSISRLHVKKKGE